MKNFLKFFLAFAMLCPTIVMAQQKPVETCVNVYMVNDFTNNSQKIFQTIYSNGIIEVIDVKSKTTIETIIESEAGAHVVSISGPYVTILHYKISPRTLKLNETTTAEMEIRKVNTPSLFVSLIVTKKEEQSYSVVETQQSVEGVLYINRLGYSNKNKLLPEWTETKTVKENVTVLTSRKDLLIQIKPQDEKPGKSPAEKVQLKKQPRKRDVI